LTNLEDLTVTLVSRDTVTGEQTGSQTLVENTDFTLSGNTLELIGTYAGWDETIDDATEADELAAGTQVGDDVEVLINPNNGLQGEVGYRVEASVAANVILAQTSVGA